MADVSIDDHKKMIKAIKTKDKNLLQRLAREHILKGKEVILSELEGGTVPL
jgi:DNA-binding GntR family transcriptional regulator